MDCKEISSDIQLYVDDELPDERQQAVKNHLSQCEACEANYHAERIFKSLIRERLMKKTATMDLINDVREAVNFNI